MARALSSTVLPAIVESLVSRQNEIQLHVDQKMPCSISLIENGLGAMEC